MDDLINTLETKYVDKKGSKRGRAEVDDDEFERIQRDMLKNKKKV